MSQIFPPVAGTSAGREVLLANRTYFVNPTLGNDSNDGLATGAGAFQTLVKAVDTVKTLDLGEFDVTIQLDDDTYNITNSERLILGPYVTAGGIAKVLGNAGTPTNVQLTAQAGFTLPGDTREAMIVIAGGATWEIGGMAISNQNSAAVSGENIGILVKERSVLKVTEDVTFNTVSSVDTFRCLSIIEQSITLGSNSAVFTFDSDPGGIETFEIGFDINHNSTLDMGLAINSGDVTFAANNEFNLAYVRGLNNSIAKLSGVNYSGTLTATDRYLLNGNTTVQDNGIVPVGTNTDTLANGSVVY